MADSYRCHVCHGTMLPQVVSRTFSRQNKESKVVTTKTLTVTEFICEKCGEGLYESSEVERIEAIMLKAVG